MRGSNFRESYNLFLAGETELYADPLVKACVPHGEYIRFLGQGGEKAAILYKDLHLQQLRVLQIMLPELTMEAEKRFFRGARIQSKIAAAEMARGQVPPFPIVFGVNEYPPYILMEYVKGVTLREYMDNQPGLGLVEKLHMFKQIALGLSLLHGHNVVHRDVKPDNIMVDEFGFPRWIDFGIAMSAAENPLTSTNQALGTPDYAPPEQMDDAANVSHLADVYALGKVLFYLITNEESFNPEKLPCEMLMVLPRTLMAYPERRHQSVMELLEDVADSYPDVNLLGDDRPNLTDRSVAGAFCMLIILFGANPGKVKMLLRATLTEWEELMQMAKLEMLSK